MDKPMEFYRPEYIIYLKDTLDIFSKYLKNGGIGTREFIINEFKRQNVFEDDNEMVAATNEIENTIDEIDFNFMQISDYKKRGIPTSKWIEDKIGAIIQECSIKDIEALVKNIHTGLHDANNDILASLINSKNATNTENILVDCSFEGINKSVLARHFYDGISDNTFLTFACGGWAAYSSEKVGEYFSKPLSDYIECDLDNPNDKSIKKVVTCSTITCAKKGYIKFGTNKSAVETSLLVDRCLTTLKVSYKVSKEEISIPDAFDYIADRTAAGVGAAIEHVCVRAVGYIGEKVGEFLGSYLGSSGEYVLSAVGRAVGETVGKKVGEKLGEGCSKLVRKASEWVKSKYKNVVAPSVSNLKNKIKNFFV